MDRPAEYKTMAAVERRSSVKIQLYTHLDVQYLNCPLKVYLRNTKSWY